MAVESTGIVITPRAPVVVRVSPSPPPDTIAGTIEVTENSPGNLLVSPGPDSNLPVEVITIDTGRVGPPGPGLPITFCRRGDVLVMPPGLRYRFPFSVRLAGISAALGSPPVGSPIVVELLVNGTAMHQLVIPEGAYEVAEVPLVTEVDSGGYLSVAIISVGSSEPGSDLSLFIRYTL